MAFEAKILMYADDTSIVASNKDKKDLSQTLSNNLSQINHWFEANGLKLNPDKTQYINFHLNHVNNPQTNFSFIPLQLNSVTSTRFLGLEIDSTLTWRRHIHSLLPKLSKAFYALLALSQSVNSKILRQAYFAYFHSLISYGLIFWGNSCESSRVFLSQKRAIRLLAGAGSREPCKPHFQRLGILPLPSLFIFQCFNFFKTNRDRFFSKNHQHNHFTRNSTMIQYPIHRTSFFEATPSYICSKIYNEFPIFLRNEPSLSKSKRLAFEFLLEHSFYSVDEFLSPPTRLDNLDT